MTIQEVDFKLEYDEGCGFFDLYLLHIVNAKNADKRREEFQLEGYSMPLETALRRVIKYRLNKKLGVVDLKTYLKEYTNECEEISKLVSEYNLH